MTTLAKRSISVNIFCELLFPLSHSLASGPEKGWRRCPGTADSRFLPSFVGHFVGVPVEVGGVLLEQLYDTSASLSLQSLLAMLVFINSISVKIVIEERTPMMNNTLTRLLSIRMLNSGRHSRLNWCRDDP